MVDSGLGVSIRLATLIGASVAHFRWVQYAATGQWESWAEDLAEAGERAWNERKLREAFAPYAAEHDAIGIPFEPVGTRVARLTEAIRVFKGCFGDEPFSFAGTHYTISAYDARPKPVQRQLFLPGAPRYQPDV